jgi:competence protein ComEA
MAGGFIAEADTAIVNQAERLWDGAQIHVPSRVEQATFEPPPGVSGLLPTPTSFASRSLSVGRININTASAAELETLPGIGPSKAAAIIENRPYTTVDDLTRVPGIGEKTVDQLRELVVAQ